MTFAPTIGGPLARWTAALSFSLSALLGAAGTAGAQAATQATQATQATDSARAADPRVGLKPGLADAGEAARNVRLIAHRDRPEKFFNPADPADFSFANTDLAFRGTTLFLGGYNGVQIWDIADPKNPTLKGSLVCPGGQGDPSIHKNLLFISVEETRGRTDCGGQGVPADSGATQRFIGVRIFDVSDVQNPKQVGAVQTCRGSHTHTLVPDPRDSTHVYVYVSGTSGVRPEKELAGCTGGRPEENPNTAYFRIEVIDVPLAAPQNARIVSTPRIFADAAGNIAGLWKGGPHGEGTQRTSETNQCHDLTVYSAIGLAAGACSGNGILLDIKDPANPKRIAEVVDPNFAYWHSATFNNDGTKVLFTDEWGGGGAPRCQATDRPTWGANAIFTLANRKLTQAGYYKLPAPQSALENCVAHNGMLIPVPGRDIMVQAWYQGGMSIFDYTDPAKPVEIAFFDRGPMSADRLNLGGYWSTYWYNGLIYGSEIGRGLDVFELLPSTFLSQNEIDAAKSVRVDELNVQNQTRITWPASFSVARAYVDQLQRSKGLSTSRLNSVSRELDRVEKLPAASRRAPLQQLATQLQRDVRASNDGGRVTALSEAVQRLAQ